MSRYIDRRRTVRADAPQHELEAGLERAQNRQLAAYEAEQDRLQALADEREARQPWRAGDPCHACGSTNTYGYAGNAGCRDCHAHDQDGG